MSDSGHFYVCSACLGFGNKGADDNFLNVTKGVSAVLLMEISFYILSLKCWM